MRVAVIGAGAAGLVTAHELGVEGHRVTVFEQSRHVRWPLELRGSRDLVSILEGRNAVLVLSRNRSSGRYRSTSASSSSFASASNPTGKFGVQNPTRRYKRHASGFVRLAGRHFIDRAGPYRDAHLSGASVFPADHTSRECRTRDPTLGVQFPQSHQQRRAFIPQASERRSIASKIDVRANAVGPQRSQRGSAPKPQRG